ncbi:hypothetical protein HMN09_00200100 [Mycena chlorophos]|uniref:Uncharacterized protein n=1 Tax=Mycena chlorophos TaxID=658473 RepID=A0A8H6WKU8_MYCCL|nr:hypothetical protein HMN09_00200100 [Mycena chlorophos]
MAPVAPGEPKPSPKPQPMGGNMPMIFLFTTCTLCFLFILWRRASALRAVISHQLKTMASTSGAIRLSEDGGPPASAFLEDDYDDDNEGLSLDVQVDEAVAARPREIQAAAEMLRSSEEPRPAVPVQPAQDPSA